MFDACVSEPAIGTIFDVRGRAFTPCFLVTALLAAFCHDCLAAEGSPDSFFAGRQLTTAVRALAVQPDGKVLIGGLFSSVDGNQRKALARLRADGSVDGSFNPEIAGTNVVVETIAVQSDGKILIGGVFATVNGIPRGNIAKLNADGSLDMTFGDSQAGANGKVNAIAQQPDGKILLGGSFTSVNADKRGGIARLEADGSLDNQFGAGLSGAVGAVADVLLLRDGSIFIAGYFNKVNDVSRAKIARLGADGSLDGGIGPGGPDGTVLGLSLQSDGKVVLVGDFAKVFGTPRKRMARLNTDGTLDAGFSPGANFEVSAVLAQRDGKVLVVGKFTEVNSVVRKGIARLDAAGQLDGNFANGDGADAYVSALAQQADGKIIAVGDFTTIGGLPRQRVARLEATLPRDVTPPTIVLNGSNPMTVPFASGFVDPGARVVDDSDAERTVFGSGFVDTNQPGAYTLTYIASDAAGNAAAAVVRTVFVSPAPPPLDRVAPTITLLGDNPITVTLGSVFSDPGAEVVDDRDEERTISGIGVVNANQAGTYTLTYIASDAAGNAAAGVVRTVHVTAISKLELVKSSLTVKSGKKVKAVILLSNNTTVTEKENLQINVVSGADLVTIPGKLPFTAAGKKRPTSPPKVTRVSLTVTAAPGQKGPAQLEISYKGRTAVLNVTVK